MRKVLFHEAAVPLCCPAADPQRASTTTAIAHTRQDHQSSTARLSPSIINSWIVELDRWTANLMFDQVLTGSLCFLGLAIYMYVRFIRRNGSAAATYEQVRPMKEAQSPPSREADVFIQTNGTAAQRSPPQRKPSHVFQHPMRRRTHSSMTNTDPMAALHDMSIAIEQGLPDDSFFAKSPPGVVAKDKLLPPVPRKGIAAKKTKQAPTSVSPDVDLFSEIPSDKSSIVHLESQRHYGSSGGGGKIDIVLDMPRTAPSGGIDMVLPAGSPPPPPRAKLLLDDRQQPAQMQLEVARKAHIPLFLHLPILPPPGGVPQAALPPPPRPDDVVVSPPPPPPPPMLPPQPRQQTPSHAIKRPVRSNTFNFRIEFAEITMGELIGQGAFGTVHKGLWRGTQVAIKILQVQHLSPDVLEEFETEVHIMSVLRHPNICLLMGACLDPPTRCLVIEYLPKGSLWSVLRQPAVTIDLAKQLSFAMDTALGMHYLHTFDPPILHRDLKSPNLLVDGSFRLKISDFGLARVKAHHQTMTGNCGTTQWMAPEVLAADKYTEKADVFSFGVVCWETVTHACPYDGLSQIQAALGVLNHNLRPTIPTDCPPFLKRLMTLCWGPVPEKRPTFAHIIDMLQSHHT
ncbi:Aste57867_116 [Aphanomyces stellatus]|uniref:non-specific serine/threonine protein kinase n=1 Tax=Aphanomyces stellatus TaxID=120398 RepID=A0A485K205_9STRA|nr:hypothetical protein As57867_000116 [Aphanomyces stellatus]VFT77342.1 Aste57867_116 [Aphanomyces stellatus]